MSDIKLFNATAKHWVEEYTNPGKNLLKKKLLDLGFNEQHAKTALENNYEDLEKAINSLVGGY